MKRKIGPGVYVDETGRIIMEKWVIDDRKSRGLSVPTPEPCTCPRPWLPGGGGTCETCGGWVEPARRLTPSPAGPAGTHRSDEDRNET